MDVRQHAHRQLRQRVAHGEGCDPGQVRRPPGRGRLLPLRAAHPVPSSEGRLRKST